MVQTHNDVHVLPPTDSGPSSDLGTEAMLSGQLAAALDELKMKSEENLGATDVAAIKAGEFRKPWGNSQDIP